MKYFVTADEFDNYCSYEVRDIEYLPSGEIVFLHSRPDELAFFLEGVDYNWVLLRGLNKQYRVPFISEETEAALKKMFGEDIQEIEWSPARGIPRKATILLKKQTYLF